MTDGNPTKFGVTEDAKTYLESGDGSFENEDYVGYGHPPKASQWKKGCKSPNPGGRPRKNESRRHILEKIAYRRVEVKYVGESISVPILQAILMTVKVGAAQDLPAATRVFEWVLGLNNNIEDETITKAVLIAGEKMTAEEWQDEFGKLANTQHPQSD